jgi:SAM-dependent methyltransferase
MPTPIDELQEIWDERATKGKTDAERIESSARPQRMRFNMFSKHHDLRGASVLDVGCGVGDFLAHSQLAGLEIDYVGVDLSSAMVELAKERHPGVRFEHRNILNWEPERTFDYVVAFGIHNVQIDGAERILRDVTHRQFELASKAAHFSLLTTNFVEFGPTAMPWNPAEILTMGLEVTPWVTIRHDYLPHDFSVSLYREALADVRPSWIDGPA